MKNSLKSVVLAAFAALTVFVAPTSAQAQDHPQFDRADVIDVGGVFYDDDGYIQHHPRQRHHRNGFSLEFQFGQPPVFYHTRPAYRQRQFIQLSQAHVQWCYDRYRTYNHRSNSFVIRHGQRAYCVSPYSH